MKSKKKTHRHHARPKSNEMPALISHRYGFRNILFCFGIYTNQPINYWIEHTVTSNRFFSPCSSRCQCPFVRLTDIFLFSVVASFANILIVIVYVFYCRCSQTNIQDSSQLIRRDNTILCRHFHFHTNKKEPADAYRFDSN